MWNFSSIMIYLGKQEYSVRYQEKIVIVKGTREKLCPVCKGILHVHGTCCRKVRTLERTSIFRLRVMKCGSCGKTHRELPHFFVPYKRYGLDAICEILCAEVGRETCSASAKCRLITWFACVMTCAKLIISEECFESICVTNDRRSSHLKKAIVQIIYGLVNNRCGYSIVFQTRKPPS